MGLCLLLGATGGPAGALMFAGLAALAWAGIAFLGWRRRNPRPGRGRTALLAGAAGLAAVVSAAAIAPGATPSADRPAASATAVPSTVLSAPNSPPASAPAAPSPATTATAPTSTPPPAPVPAPKPKAGTALAVLDSLHIAKAGARSGYARSRFGSWTTKSGCDIRSRVLRRDLAAVAVRAGTDGCTIVKGRLADPYTGKTSTFSARTAKKVEIDHVVALADAWRTGANAWSPAQRRSFANDLLNLETTSQATNASKGESDAASWLPPKRAARCAFVARQVTVKAKYDLSVTPAERSAIARVLRDCPEQKPTTAKQATALTDKKADVVAKPKPKPKPKPQPKVDPRFGTCREANAAGYGPYSRGEPEYDWYRDRDGDGLVCER